MLISELEKSVEQLRNMPSDRQLTSGQVLRERLAALENKRAWEERFAREAEEKARAENERKKVEQERQRQLLVELAERSAKTYVQQAPHPWIIDLLRRHPRQSKHIWADNYSHIALWARERDLTISSGETFATTFLSTVFAELRRLGFAVADQE